MLYEVITESRLREELGGEKPDLAKAKNRDLLERHVNVPQKLSMQPALACCARSTFLSGLDELPAS